LYKRNLQGQTIKFDEFDKRRGKNFLETFPEMEDFYNLCKRLV